MNEFDSIKWAQQQLTNAEFRLQNFNYNQTQIDQYARNPYSDLEDRPPPFFVTLREEITIEVVDGEDQPVSNYKVTVAEGYIAEKNRSRGEPDALTYHLCNNFFEAGDPKEFPITITEAIFATFTENAEGIIDAASAELQVLPKITLPIVGNRFHYKLAELEEGEDDLEVKPFLMGSHIYHTEAAIPPFYVFLTSETTEVDGLPVTTYKVNVNGGCVVERKLQYPMADALDHHYLPPFLDQPIEVGEMVAVNVQSNVYGSISYVDFAIVPSSTMSIGADPILLGNYYYKLAEFNGGNQVTPFAMGSHIYHPTGLSGDLRFTDCQATDIYGDPVGIPTQLGRFIFVSGMLSAVNTSIDDWPETDNTVQIEVPMCSGEAIP
jgi:hypothetical protein